MRLYFFIFLLFASGCSKQNPERGCIPSSEIQRRIGQELPCTGAEQQLATALCQLRQQEMTVGTALQIALLNNPSVQATFEELGIAKADLIEAGLLSNPFFDFNVRFPNKGGLRRDINASLSVSFLDLFLMPLRKRIAQAEFEEVKSRVSHTLLKFAFDLQETYYQLQTAQSQLQAVQEMTEIAAIQEEIASRQRSAGNIDKLKKQFMEAELLEAEIEAERLRAEIIPLNEKLNRLLGFACGCQWALPKAQFDLDFPAFPLEQLEAVAFSERLDLQEARWKVIRLSRTAGVKQWWAYTDGRIGISSESEPEGFTVLGPAIAGALPFFNYGQAARRRLAAELRQAAKQLEALELQTLGEVREAHKLLASHLSSIEDYRERLLPLKEQLLNSSEELYNAMGLGIDQLLESKKSQLQAYKSYLLSMRNYWSARVGLDRALGGHLHLLLGEGECE